jgi:1-acyl-sn-glycerol-3-phosphate acyltransferase
MCVAIFPQGGRISRTPLADFHNHRLKIEGQTGVGRVILQLNGRIPVIPFYIHGSAEALGRGQKAPRWGSFISIKFGEPIYFNQFSQTEGWRINKEFFLTARLIVNQIMERIWDLLREVEVDFLEFLERKLGFSINTSTINDDHERIFNKLLTKLSKVSPKEIHKYVKSLYRE